MPTATPNPFPSFIPAEPAAFGSVLFQLAERGIEPEVHAWDGQPRHIWFTWNGTQSLIAVGEENLPENLPE